MSDTPARRHPRRYRLLTRLLELTASPAARASAPLADAILNASRERPPRHDRTPPLATHLGVLAGSLAVRRWIAYGVVSTGPSMQPTFASSASFGVFERVSATLNRPPRRGDIVDADSPHGSLLKRVVGLPGEHVDVDEDGRVSVNGAPLDEGPRLYGHVPGSGGHWIVPDDSVFLLGDNRPNSRDSRRFGPVPRNQLRGRLLASTGKAS